MLYDVFGPAWNGVDDIDRAFRDFNRLFTSSIRSTDDTYSALNVWANDEAVAVTAEIPGVDPKDVSISLVGDTLTVSGKRRAEQPQGNITWLRQERGEFEFSRTIQLPYSVDADQTEARQKDGVLTIALRRQESGRPRKIAVKPS